MRYKEAVKLLREAGVGSADYDARELFVHFGGFNRSEIFLSDPECAKPELTAAIERRAAREPLQYIIGEVEFYREVYRVTPDCLIPRADTEILVDYAVRSIPEGASFMDLCTGSGCVAISTLKNTKNTTAISVDIDGGALAIAEENAASTEETAASMESLTTIIDECLNAIAQLEDLSNDLGDKVQVFKM